ncbi:aldose 1-epimerase family protein [Pectinatus frisingensis]|uniref:aldose 1-epimerase family protein n=1 Tax=Pectinatus frisingensis TaxID=865 RepID=UPI0018C81FA2|nr:aldose 1-epimerase family protein [Pectinatus frisingensis]
MRNKIFLKRSFFTSKTTEIFKNEEFTVEIFIYSSGVEAIKINNSRGYVIVLPYMGQIIWDVNFDGIDLRMKNMFSQPKPAGCIIDTYGCFAFHSGLLSNGCPSPEDTHIMHGEMSCAVIDEAWLEIDEAGITVTGKYEYCQGFCYHYIANPSVELNTNSTKIKIGMKVKNLTSIMMPLQYMCHMNYAYVDNAVITSNIPEKAFKLRESIPAHVKPTPKWIKYNEDIKQMQKTGKTLTKLEQSDMYDPEIVFMADDVKKYAARAVFEMDSPKGYGFATEFSTSDFPCATRWIMYNGDLQVAAFVLPATCRPEGFLAAKKAGTLVMLDPNEEKTFSVLTGKK